MAIALVGTGTSAANGTVSAPTGVGPGTILVAHASAGGGGAPAFAWPAGWQVVAGVSVSGFHRSEVAFLPYSSGTSWSVTGAQANVCAAYSGVDPSAFYTSNFATWSNNTNPAITPSVTNPDPAAWFLCSFATAEVMNFNSYTASAVERAEISPQPSCALADSNGPVSAGSKSVQCTMSGFSGSGVAFIGILKPAANPGQFFAFL